MPIESAFVGIHTRSYAERLAPDRHEYAQLVLPLAGEVLLEVDGTPGRIDPMRAAVVDALTWHAQCGLRDNRVLIVDVDASIFGHAHWSRLTDKPFHLISPAARKLVEFMELSLRGPVEHQQLVQGWMPLLLDTLSQTEDQPQWSSRLGALLAFVRASLDLPWTTASMAERVHLSASRFHTLFQEEVGTSPYAWLKAQRIERACDLLASTNAPIADIALRAGFGDQSTLTRAMRLAIDTTPSAYRRQKQQEWHKAQ